MHLKSGFILLLIIGLLSCGPSDQNVNAQYRLVQAFPNLTFTRPVDLQDPADDSNRLFVVEQRGVISVFENNSGVADRSTFLDIQEQVDDRGNEEGLLGLAFHPDYESNGYFYVDYTTSSPPRTVVSRFSVSADDSNQADPGSEQVILEVSQPYDNHNGGQIAFGPDGYLYIALGDGGAGGDPQNNGQDRSTLLGTILRIDVDTQEGDLNYGIPDENPFSGNTQGYREEIYAYGLRNPWRFSFDSETGQLWTGDVGQNMYEEVDLIESGENYGWNIMEGFHCYNAATCDTTGRVLPEWEYGHGDEGGLSITGGFVYRGSAVPDLVGKYIYADYVSGRIWALNYVEDGENTNSLLLNSDLNISSFGTDRHDVLYMCAFDGKIYKFESTSTGTSSFGNPLPETYELTQNFPNPFNRTTTIRYRAERSVQVTINIYDLVGRLVRSLTDRHHSTGWHILIWNGRDNDGESVASGTYFYQMIAESFASRMQKMTLLK